MRDIHPRLRSVREDGPHGDNQQPATTEFYSGSPAEFARRAAACAASRPASRKRDADTLEL